MEYFCIVGIFIRPGLAHRDTSGHHHSAWLVAYCVGLHQARLQSLNKSYSSEKAALLGAACKERLNTGDKAEFACEFLQTVIYDMNSRNQHKHKRNTTNSAAKQDELRNQVKCYTHFNNITCFLNSKTKENYLKNLNTHSIIATLYAKHTEEKDSSILLEDKSFVNFSM